MMETDVVVEAEKKALIQEIFDLQESLRDLRDRILEAQKQHQKLSDDNDVLLQYLENLISQQQQPSSTTSTASSVSLSQLSNVLRAGRRSVSSNSNALIKQLLNFRSTNTSSTGRNP